MDETQIHCGPIFIQTKYKLVTSELLKIGCWILLTDGPSGACRTRVLLGWTTRKYASWHELRSAFGYRAENGKDYWSACLNRTVSDTLLKRSHHFKNLRHSHLLTRLPVYSGLFQTLLRIRCVLVLPCTIPTLAATQFALWSQHSLA